MAAISAAFSTLAHGARVVASDQGYSGVMTLLNQYNTSGRLVVTFVDLSKTDDVLAALPGADLLWLESPTNPCLDVAELPTLISAAKAKKILVMVDNTFATALTQRPLEMGADVVMNSVTKFLSGHSDLLMGSLSTKNDSEQFQAHSKHGLHCVEFAPSRFGFTNHARAHLSWQNASVLILKSRECAIQACQRILSMSAQRSLWRPLARCFHLR
jgi:cystathionine gamma-synthase